MARLCEKCRTCHGVNEKCVAPKTKEQITRELEEFILKSNKVTREYSGVQNSGLIFK